MKQIIVSIILFCAVQIYGQDVEFLNLGGFLSLGTEENRTASITLFDIDKDGDLDALVANGRHWAEQNFIFFNNGEGVFKTAMPLGRLRDASYAVGAGDFNGDGFNDIAVVNDNAPNKIYWGDGDLRFEKESSFGNPLSPSRNLTVADIDKDGDLDLIISNRQAVNEICFNDGKGNFENIRHFGEEKNQTIEIEVADINKDGFLDLITAERQA
ncbi:MAG: VCBS repeat-containing protein, partial [Pyrinomonadaceae bacterium]